MEHDPILGPFALSSEIERLAPGDGASGRRAATLVKADGLRVVLVTMRRGAVLAEHTAPGPITIQALRGSFLVTVGAVERSLPAGELISVGAQVPHAVRAVEDGAFLLTIGWPHGQAGEPAAVTAP
ncbi:MAG: cupin domain-containing protein [Sphaerobacter sp.]|nr:cupin domain-containing protein [Sphaerobacter sp.]